MEAPEKLEEIVKLLRQMAGLVNSLQDQLEDCRGRIRVLEEAHNAQDKLIEEVMDLQALLCEAGQKKETRRLPKPPAKRG